MLPDEISTFHLRHGPKRSIRRVQPVFGRRGNPALNPPNIAIWPPITSDRYHTRNTLALTLDVKIANS